MHNMRLGAIKRQGLDYETLSSINRNLVYAQASAWGPKGPLASNPGYDAMAIGRSGLMYMVGAPSDPPQLFLSGLSDQLGAMTMISGILAALFFREKEGKGQLVNVSLLGSLISLESSVLASKLMTGFEFQRGSRKEVNPLNNYYKAADDKWFTICMHQSDRYWPLFCKAVGIEELEKDPRFENIRVRHKYRTDLISILDKIFATKKREEWIKRFKEVVDELIGPIQTVDEVVNDQQVLENNYIVEYDHPTYGRDRVVGLPYEFSDIASPVVRPAPEFGQHTEEVLLDIGYSWQDITELKEQEVI